MPIASVSRTRLSSLTIVRVLAAAALAAFLTVGCSSGPAATPDATSNIGKCCNNAWDCPGQHCMFSSAASGEFCSSVCTDDEDCPERSGCARVGDGQGGFVLRCLPCELVANTNPRYCPKEAGIFNCIP